MAPHSSILAWRSPWTEEPGGLQSTGSQRVPHDWYGALRGETSVSPFAKPVFQSQNSKVPKACVFFGLSRKIFYQALTQGICSLKLNRVDLTDKKDSLRSFRRKRAPGCLIHPLMGLWTLLRHTVFLALGPRVQDCSRGQALPGTIVETQFKALIYLRGQWCHS